MSEIAAGWYRNQETPDEQRFWDGTQWTEDTARQVSVVSDPEQARRDMELLKAIKKLNGNAVGIRWMMVAMMILVFVVPLLVRGGGWTALGY